jgi:Ran GTPase-activating protein (RanGAP) involved in mRNA processing and transport
MHSISQLFRSSSVVSHNQDSSIESAHAKKQFYPGPIGKQAKLDFYQVYRGLGKTKEKNRFKRIEDSPHTAYLLEAERSRLKPLSMGISRSRGSETTIDLKYGGIGDKYAKALSKGIKHVENIEHLNLRSNRLSEIGSSSILKQVQPSRLQDLNLSDNRIGAKSLAYVVELLLNSRSAIRSLDLESTGIKGPLLMTLCQAVSDNHSLRSLNLAKNSLDEQDAASIGQMLSLNNSLKKLDLHWNGLRGEGAVKFFTEGVKLNDSLEEVDLSFNALGNSSPQLADALGLALQDRARLVHLDLSFNYFTEGETRTLSTYLDTNHDLLGLHYEGNDGYVDSRGFVKVMSHASNMGQAHTFRRIFGAKRNVSEKNCWLCHGWRELKFTWKPGQSGSAAVEPVYLHLECDGYLPESMPLQGNEFSVVRAVPNSLCKFFFSFKGSPMLSAILPSRTSKAKAFCEFWTGFAHEIDIDQVNYVEPEGPSFSVAAQLGTRPRVVPYKYTPLEAEKAKVPWSIPISLFKDYRFDFPVRLMQDYYMKCFEFDWNCCKLPKLIKDPEELGKIKELLRGGYKHM